MDSKRQERRRQAGSNVSRETVLREEPEVYDIGTKVPTAPILEAQEGDDAVSLERGLSVLRSN